MTTTFTFASAVETGAAHIARGQACQDDACVGVDKVDGTTWAIASVADGAGSTEFGGVGAAQVNLYFSIVVSTGLHMGLGNDLDALMRSALTYARAELQIEAETYDLPLGAFATTFSAVVSNGTKTGFIQIGDGAILARGEAGWKLVTEPQNGEYANETWFVTCDDWFERLETRVVEEPLSAVVLMTDGIRELILKPTRELNTDFLSWVYESLSAAPEPGDDTATAEVLRALLASEGLRELTADDTSVVAIRVAGSGAT